MAGLFGLFVATSGADPTWFGVALAVFGVAVLLSAVGVVEVAMALYYRAQRDRRRNTIEPSAAS